VSHYASPGRNCLKDDGHEDKCVPGPWYGSRPSRDPSWSHEHHLTGALGTCAQCGKHWEKQCHQSRRKYCSDSCYRAARRNLDRVRLREYQRARTLRIVHNKRIEAERHERIRVRRLVAEERRRRAEGRLNGVA
jgi:hypothetical protein